MKLAVHRWLAVVAIIAVAMFASSADAQCTVTPATPVANVAVVLTLNYADDVNYGNRALYFAACTTTR